MSAQKRGGSGFVPRPGDLVTDTARGQVGIARAWDGRRVTLKDPAGQDLWTTTEFRKPTAWETLRARLAEENHDSSRRWPR
ncbi:hypothetical protein RKE29_12605 [Streptomyces sp. B1866]|uniref:hypothetical protein n=1 Tax=Streptomyces sp. B1866 TaxID=3075431 RepID=UPI002891DF62|nr:hypothetical protein [Streptomyces sp. B1866]MDT3397480.1 hypothetical protein [Streptomyces sp. B1866]